jgi:DNA-directed RNA polymerase subunit RPC12/RpoP
MARVGKKCECGILIELSFNENKDTKNYTEVFVICARCGKYVEFELPISDLDIRCVVLTKKQKKR